MEFWGVEVKAGEPVEVNPEDLGKCIHLSQAALGEAKKASEPAVLYLKIGDQKLVLGTLSQEKFPQLSFDLVLEKKFELSHNWKNGSVYFCGYKAELAGDLEDELSDSEDDEDLPLVTKENAKPDIKTEAPKPAVAKSNDVKPGESKKQVKVVEPKKDEDESEEDDESDDEDDENESSDEDMLGGDSDSDDESESDEDDEEIPPKKADQSKKRPNESASVTPVAAKKAKPGTPQKTDGKKGGHVATPHPKKGEQTPKSETKNQTPKSGGQFTCKSCSKSFTSEGGLQQHSKAKHGGQ